MDEKIISSIVEKFEIASKEFNFNFIQPYCIGENHKLCFFGYLFKDNPERGVEISKSESIVRTIIYFIVVCI